MKHKLLSILFLSFLLSFVHESMAQVKKHPVVAKKTPIKKRILPMTINSEIGPVSPTEINGNDSAQQMRNAYRQLSNCYALKRTDGSILQGVIISKSDFDNLKGGTYAQLAIEIGLRNYGQLADIIAGKVKPDYSVMIVPLIMISHSPNPSEISRVYRAGTTNYVAYDYGCPCPGSACCPKD